MLDQPGLTKIFEHMKSRYLPFTILGVFLVILGTWGQARGASPKDISEESLNELFHQVLYHVENDYVEKTDKQKIWFGAINGMLRSLGDEHTRFLPPVENKDLSTTMSGEFGGLGIEITLKDQVLTIVSPIQGTPAMRAGLQPGDKIVEIDKKSTSNMSLNEAVKLMRGTPGTSVNLSIAREEEEELLYFDIVRDVIQITVVQKKIIESKNIGYVRLKTFSKLSYEKVSQAVEQFVDKKVNGIIFDLRYNAGGLLESAYKVANVFLNKGIIVSTRGRQRKLDRVYRANPRLTITRDIPLVVLVNEGSASASEIVTGAIKDNSRGTIVGVKTFGKGSVQNVIQLEHGTAVALTIQKYYTPSGKSIHKQGIDPDIVVKSLEFTREDRRHYREIKEKKILNEFVKKNPGYTQSNISKFRNMLKKRGLALNDFAARSTLKQYINRNKPKTDLIDLEFDVQLKKAIAHFK